jgi:hypothetical protein
LFTDRIPIIRELEEARDSRCIIYVTGDRPPNLQTQIAPDVLDFFADHLDTFDSPKKISLFLYSEGGITLAGWSIVNLIRLFCDKFEVIIPRKAHSTATLIAIGADGIMMTKQATLGPVDPSVNGPLNPQVPGQQALPGQQLPTLPISVEAVISYGQLARDEFGLRKGELPQVYLKLAEFVHPLVLGDVYRARTQIKMLAGNLLKQNLSDQRKINQIVGFLCSESGSHDYTINRREAEKLGLPVIKPTDSEYNIVRRLYEDIKAELKLKEPFNPHVMLGEAEEHRYSLSRCVLESTSGGSHKFITHGVIRKQGQVLGPAQAIIPQVVDLRYKEGWEHEVSYSE